MEFTNYGLNDHKIHSLPSYAFFEDVFRWLIVLVVAVPYDNFWAWF
jgi:hypothetical protein